MDQTESDSPRRELSNGGLESVVTLLVRWQINYSEDQICIYQTDYWHHLRNV